MAELFIWKKGKKGRGAGRKSQFSLRISEDGGSRRVAGSSRVQVPGKSSAAGVVVSRCLTIFRCDRTMASSLA